MLLSLIENFLETLLNNSLLPPDKTISSLLDSIGQWLLISEYVLQKHYIIVSDFDEKLTQSVAQKLCNITCQKTFFPFTLQLVRCFQFQSMIWKMEHGSENPNFYFVLLLFALLTPKPFILCPVSVVAASCFNYIDPCTWF